MKFTELWQQFHGGSTPLGWELREAEKPNWVRFHSLPGSKRYPKTDDEDRIILERQNTIADRVLGRDAACWIVCCLMENDEHPEWQQSHHQLISSHKMQPEWSFLYDAEADVRFGVFAGQTLWRPHSFDAELLQIANERLAALWIAERTGAVFAPYDGGVDCILPTRDAMMNLRNQYPSWLPSHPEGL